MRYFKPLLLSLPKSDLKRHRRINPFSYFLPFKKLKNTNTKFPWHSNLGQYLKKKDASRLRATNLIKSKKFTSTTLVFPTTIEPKRILNEKTRRLVYWWYKRTEEDKRNERIAAAERRRKNKINLLKDVLLNLQVSPKTNSELIERGNIFRALAYRIEKSLHPDLPEVKGASSADTPFAERTQYPHPGKHRSTEESPEFWHKLHTNPTLQTKELDKLVPKNLRKVRRNNARMPLSLPYKHSFDIQFLRKEFVYTKLKYSRSPAYDAVSGGFAALFAGFVGFLISEKFGIELVDSGDFYIVLMYLLIGGFSGRLLLSCTSLTNSPYLPVSLYHNFMFFKELFKFIFQNSWLKR